MPFATRITECESGDFELGDDKTRSLVTTTSFISNCAGNLPAGNVGSSGCDGIITALPLILPSVAPPEECDGAEEECDGAESSEMPCDTVSGKVVIAFGKCEFDGPCLLTVMS